MNHATWMNHVARPPYSALSFRIFGEVSCKASYADSRTPRGPRMGFREPFSFRPNVQPQVKVLPSGGRDEARPSRRPETDVCARQPFQRAIAAFEPRIGQGTSRPTKSARIIPRSAEARQISEEATRKIAFAKHGDNRDREARSPYEGYKAISLRPLCALFAAKSCKTKPRSNHIKAPSCAPKLRFFSRKARLRRWHKGGAEDSRRC